MPGDPTVARLLAAKPDVIHSSFWNGDLEALILQALESTKGNVTHAAKKLGISRRTLHRKIAQWPELDVLDK